MSRTLAAAAPLLLLGLCLVPRAAATAPSSTAADTVYRTVLLRAAPGALDALLDLYRARRPVYDEAGVEQPVLMRHSQGDQWDLLVLFPIAGLAEYFSEDHLVRLEAAGNTAGLSESGFQDSLRVLTVFREEVFVAGPPLEELRDQADGAGLYHIEMFVALPGRYEELVEQRRMENVYYHATERAGNLIFTRLAGARWDVFTVGFYEDMQHFAADPDLPREVLEQAAIDAGFESRSTIGTYLRELIHHHNDTLAVPVR
ncbi:MAG: hypothetical protein ACE5FP_04840 [Gemmatimonadota bacterium]